MRCSIISAVHTSQSALFTYQCALCNVQCAVINVQCVHCNAQYSLCIVQLSGDTTQWHGASAVPTICCGCFQIQLHIDPRHLPASPTIHNTPPRNTRVHKYTLVFDNISNRKSCIAKSRRIPRRGATLKFTSTPRMQGRCCGRGPMFNFQTTLWTLGGWWQIQNTQNTKWKYKITDAKLSSSCWSCVV